MTVGGGYHQEWRYKMHGTGNRVLFTSLACLLALQIGTAGEPPSLSRDGEAHILQFSTPPIYDLSGDYAFNLDDAAQLTETTFSWTLIQDSRGRISGTGSSVFVIRDRFGVLAEDHIELTIEGNIKQSKTAPVVKLKIGGEGLEQIRRIETSYRAALKSRIEPGELLSAQPIGQLVVAPPRLIGVLKEQHCAAPKICGEKTAGEIEVFLPSKSSPAASLGGWKLELRIDQDGERISGVAVAHLPGGREIEFSAAGMLSTRTATAIVIMKPIVKDGTGTLRLRMQYDTDQEGKIIISEVLEVKGSLLGQKFKERY